jgi:hypothetical protein
MLDTVLVPRTTLNIDGTVLTELKNRQRASGHPLGDLVSTLLAEALSAQRSSAARPDFTWSCSHMEARVDLEDVDALQRLLDAR